MGYAYAEVCPKHPILAPIHIRHYWYLKILLLALGPSLLRDVYASGAVAASVTLKLTSKVERCFAGAIIEFLLPNIGFAGKTIYVKF